MPTHEPAATWWCPIWLAVCCGCTGVLSAQPAPERATGTLTKQTYTSPIDGAEIDYALWLPPDYQERSSWPLIVQLHGSGKGTDWRAPTNVKASVPVLGSLSDLPFVVVFPLMRGSWSISALAERDVIDTIAAVQARFAVDPDRVHLVGLSFGGFAAWRIACRYPDLFASLTVFCGGGEPDLAVNLRHLPIRVFHGAKDQRVPVARSREMVAALGRADIPVSFVEDPEGSHVVGREALGSRLLYQWMSNQVRVRHPRRVSYRTHSLRHASAYWLTIESMSDPSVPASVDAFAPPGQGLVVVHAENVGRLVLDPAPEVVEPGRPPQFVVNSQPTEAVRTDRGWVLELDEAPAEGLAKCPGLSGPIQDVLNDAFVVSVPSAGKPEIIRRWQAAAAQGMGWTEALVTHNVRIAPADQVTQEMMEAAHLICFGSPWNHPVLGWLVGHLPLHAEGGRVHLYGEPLSARVVAFVMIFPNPLAPNRYIVVCSGHPEAAGKLAAAVLSPPPLNQPPIEDLVLMQGDGQIVAWGRQPDADKDRDPPMGARLAGRGPVFDRNWQLTPEARAWLQSIPPPVATSQAPTQPATGPVPPE